MLFFGLPLIWLELLFGVARGDCKAVGELSRRRFLDRELLGDHYRPSIDRRNSVSYTIPEGTSFTANSGGQGDSDITVIVSIDGQGGVGGGLPTLGQGDSIGGQQGSGLKIIGEEPGGGLIPGTSGSPSTGGQQGIPAQQESGAPLQGTEGSPGIGGQPATGGQQEVGAPPQGTEGSAGIGGQQGSGGGTGANAPCPCTCSCPSAAFMSLQMEIPTSTGSEIVGASISPELPISNSSLAADITQIATVATASISSPDTLNPAPTFVSSGIPTESVPISLSASELLAISNDISVSAVSTAPPALPEAPVVPTSSPGVEVPSPVTSAEPSPATTSSVSSVINGSSSGSTTSFILSSSVARNAASAVTGAPSKDESDSDSDGDESDSDDEDINTSSLQLHSTLVFGFGG